MTVWFTSDLHVGHRKVAELRGFSSTFDHDLEIARGLMAALDKHSDLWVLGDLAVSNPAAALELLGSLPGRKHLIAGNHDKCHPMHRDSHNWQRRYLEVFDSVQPFARRRIDGTEVLLSHFPYERDRDEPRHTQWRLRNEGAWLLHGHTHGKERLTLDGGRFVSAQPGYGRAKTREIHVGVDAWELKPVSVDTVAHLIRQQGELFNAESLSTMQGQ